MGKTEINVDDMMRLHSIIVRHLLSCKPRISVDVASSRANIIIKDIFRNGLGVYKQ